MTIALGRFERRKNWGHLTAFLAQRHLVSHAENRGGNVATTAVHQNVVVADKLTTRVAARSKAHAVHKVVEPKLQGLHEKLASLPFVGRSLLEHTTELGLKNTVNTLQLLLLTQLRSEV